MGILKTYNAMNTGQMLITIAALLLLSVVVLRTNNSFLITDSVLYDTKFGVLAVSLGTSVIEEATSKTFDNTSDSASVTSLNALTLPLLLGPEAGETYDTYNDFDDFNGYTRVDSSMPSAIFNISCRVNYVTTSNPDAISAIKTWHKEITVTITSVSMIDTVKMSSIYSYWYYR
ncbi:MAG: hypothetical protein A2V66_12495 [Ignavibacteria bacterium RBG_13_36_8]|nr:MAG: hypothetical protein A2V66_12495 [Ignavibacteria bacterium RBG_13_36_8]